MSAPPAARRIGDRNIWVIYAAILLLGIAYGTSLAVLALHLRAHGISELAMGALATAFASGIVMFAMPAGRAVQRFGAKTTMLVALAGYAVSVTAFPFLGTLTTLAIARFFDGAFSAGVWVSAETALLSRADKSNKAFVMSLYAISIALGYLIGPLVSRALVIVFTTGSTFIAAGALACLAGLIVLTMLDRGEITVDESDGKGHATTTTVTPATSLGQVLWRVKTSCFATFSYGYFQSSVVIFLPLYLVKEKLVSEGRTILIPAFFAAGMLSLSIWVSRIGDRRGHLAVMRVLGTIGGAMVASFVLISSFPLMCAAVFVAGATLASISPVSLALQGTVTAPRDLGRANGFYNAAYAVGMLIGPALSGVLFVRYGGATMLYHLAALWTAFVVVTIVFAADDPQKLRAHARSILPTPHPSAVLSVTEPD